MFILNFFYLFNFSGQFFVSQDNLKESYFQRIFCIVEKNIHKNMDSCHFRSVLNEELHNTDCTRSLSLGLLGTKPHKESESGGRAVHSSQVQHQLRDFMETRSDVDAKT